MDAIHVVVEEVAALLGGVVNADALHGFDHLLKAMTAPEETAAVILEPVLGEGGYIPAPPAFIPPNPDPLLLTAEAKL